MAERRDKLGRRIPEFDRSAAVRKGAKTKREKYGDDYHARTGARGGNRPGRGYFGKLKDEGRLDELKAVSKKGAEATNRIKHQKETETGDTPVSGGGSA